MYASVAHYGLPGSPVANERYLELSPKIPRPNQPLVGLVHAAGTTAFGFVDPDAKQAYLTRSVASEFPAVAGDNGGPQTWGNAASITALNSVLTKARLSANVHDTEYALIGNSMGGIVALNYAAQATVKPKAMVMVIPVINLADIKVNNREGYGQLINDAYGNYDELSMGNTYNPYTMRAMAKLKNIPMLIFYGLADTVCIAEYTEAFINADPAYRTGVPLPYGHDYNTYGSVDQELIMEFLREHLT